jgi:hypothetical protein
VDHVLASVDRYVLDVGSLDENLGEEQSCSMAIQSSAGDRYHKSLRSYLDCDYMGSEAPFAPAVVASDTTKVGQGECLAVKDYDLGD